MVGLALRFVDAPEATSGDLVLVLDEAWTPRADADPRVLPVRPLIGRVLANHDLWSEAIELLDAWSTEVRLAERMTIDGTSFWFHRRLGLWWWLQARLMWLHAIDELVSGERAGSIDVAEDADRALLDVVSAVAARDGASMRLRPSSQVARPEPPEIDRGPLARLATLLRQPIDRLRARVRRRDIERRRATMDRRLATIVAGPRPLLVLTEHIRQLVETRDGPRLVNAYLDPILDRLTGTSLAPVELELDAAATDDRRWAGIRRRPRTLAGDLLATRYRHPEDKAISNGRATPIIADVDAIHTPLVVSGIDLGPALCAEVARTARQVPRRLQDILRIRRFLADLRPSALLMTNEYIRVEWIAAARAEGIPIAAVQHGIIHRWHVGYLHASHPPGLPLVDRLYVFGNWERRLVLSSAAHPEAVVVSGSPRLDLLAPPPEGDRADVRAELGIAPGERLVVVSTSWGDLSRRSDVPVALAAIVDRPLPGVHLVIKLHPREPDEGSYRRLIEGVARAGGFDPPPVTIVQRIDLYRLLRAADAHVGIFSTVVTEAVVAGTPNLLASADLLGYVAAGVAMPVRDGAGLLAALDAGCSPSSEQRASFLNDHFEPGLASQRIREDLEAWLA